MERKELKLDEKIYEILKHYKESDAKLWKSDTDIYNSWCRFQKMFNENFEYNTFNTTTFNIKMHEINNKEKYQFLINNINLTPIDNDTAWSWGGIYQFIRIGHIFGFFLWQKTNKKKEICDQSFELSLDIMALFNTNFEWFDLLLSSLKETLFHNIDYFKNFGISLFLCLIYAYDKKILTSLKQNDIKFRFIRNPKEELDFNSPEWVSEVTTMSSTYKHLAEILSNKFLYVVDELFLFLKNKNKKLETHSDLISRMDSYIEWVNSNEELTITEKHSLVKTRIGQTKFKNDLFKIYPKCILSDIDIPELLIASHIVPWSECENNRDKLNPFNGFLITASIDRLFDSNLISFDENGFIYYSEKLKRKYPNYKEILSKIGVKNDYLLDKKNKSIFSNIDEKHHARYKKYLLVHLNKAKNFL